MVTVNKIKIFNNEQITILVGSIKRKKLLFINNDGIYDTSSIDDVDYPFQLINYKNIKNIAVFSRYYSLYEKDGKIGIIEFGQTIFNKILDYSKEHPKEHSIVNINVKVHDVSLVYGTCVDSYNECKIVPNTTFDKNDYPNIMTNVSDLETYCNHFLNWSTSKYLISEMNKHDDLRDYVAKIRRKNRNKKIDEIING